MTRPSPIRAAGRARRAARLATAAVAVALLSASCAGNLRGATSVNNSNAGHLHDLEHGPVDEVKTRAIPGLGTILVNGQGLTLYLFEPDRRATSTCYQICAFQWPPLLLVPGTARPIAGPGVRGSLLGTVARSDGTTQVTYNGWPLYRWLPDTAPGQATGQGLNNLGGLWYVVDPAGRAVT